MLAVHKPRLASVNHASGLISALDRVMAVIEFSPDGTIITANANFSAAMGYCSTRYAAATTACSPSPPMPLRTTTAISGRS